MKFFVRTVAYATKHSEVMTQSYITLRGILEYNRKVLRKTTGRKQNCLVSNCEENTFFNSLCQKSYEISYDNQSD